MKNPRTLASWSAVLAAAALISAGGCARKTASPPPPELAAASRTDTNGWSFIHLEGTPHDIGFQHGWLMAAEIDEALQMFPVFLEGATKRNWTFYREAAERMFWPRLNPESREEIEGIAAGLRAARPGSRHDAIDITALNGWIELAWYYVPYLDEGAKPGAGENKSPGYCSAFVATGSYTADGGIVIAHNNWVDYIVGERWNVVADIVPKTGHRILMDCFPGYIHSGDDFVVNGAGIVYTETTIGQFKSGFEEDGTPEFVRARRAAQYASTIDDFIRIMSEDNNGAYANDWLLGDINTGEIARLELGLKNQRVWRTRDGYFVGANFPSDETIIAEETTFDPADTSQSVLVRRARWEQLMKDYKGNIDIEDAKLFEGDHVDAGLNAQASNGNVLCGHVDTDPRGVPEFSWAPFSPAGSVQAKATSSVLAKEMKLWARKGHPCGRDFLAAPFLGKHPEFGWQRPFLKDMAAFPWTLFGARGS
jgi:hypothetical protein